jgi:hypothetical protein
MFLEITQFVDPFLRERHEEHVDGNARHSVVFGFLVGVSPALRVSLRLAFTS